MNNLKATLACSLCHELFKKPHSFTVCGHTFCYECVIDTLEGPGIIKSQCPTCKKPAWKKDLSYNHQFQNLVDFVTAAEKTKATQSRPERRSQAPEAAAPAEPQPAEPQPAEPQAAAEPAEEQQAAGPVRGAGEQASEPAGLGGPGPGQASAGKSAAPGNLQQDEHDPVTPSIDEFAPAWEEEVLALPPPEPAEAAQLLHEVSLLRRALLLCDSLPCAEAPAAQGCVQLEALRRERALLESEFSSGCAALAQLDGRAVRAPEAAAGAAPALGAQQQQQQQQEHGVTSSPTPGLVAAAALAETDLMNWSQPPGSSGLRNSRPSEFVPATEMDEVMPLATDVSASALPGSQQPTGSAPTAPPQPLAGPEPLAEPVSMEVAAAADAASPAAAPAGSEEAAEPERELGSGAAEEAPGQPALGKRPRQQQQQDSNTDQPVAAGDEAGRAGGKRPRGAAKQQGNTAIERKLAQAEALALPPSPKPSRRPDPALAVPGARVRVLWQEGPYCGTVLHLVPETGRHSIAYEDGEVASHDLDMEIWELLPEQQQQHGGSSLEDDAASPSEGPRGGRRAAHPREGGRDALAQRSAPAPAQQQAQAQQQAAKKGRPRGRNAGRHRNSAPEQEQAEPVAAAAGGQAIRTQDAADLLCQMAVDFDMTLDADEAPAMERRHARPAEPVDAAQAPLEEQGGAAGGSAPPSPPPAAATLPASPHAHAAEPALGLPGGPDAGAVRAEPRVRRVIISQPGVDSQSHVLMLQELLGGVHNDSAVSKHTTHVLVSLEPSGLVVTRSMKYLQGLAVGAWVVSFGWVHACLAQGRWVPEEGFEARGDAKCSEGVPAAQRRRAAEGQPGLFAGHRFLLVPQRGASTQLLASLGQLVELGGGAVVKSLPHAAGGPEAGVHVVFVSNSKGNAESAKAAAVVKHKYAPYDLVANTWILDSVSSGGLLPKAGFGFP